MRSTTCHTLLLAPAHVAPAPSRAPAALSALILAGLIATSTTCGEARPAHAATTATGTASAPTTSSSSPYADTARPRTASPRLQRSTTSPRSASAVLASTTTTCSRSATSATPSSPSTTCDAGPSCGPSPDLGEARIQTQCGSSRPRPPVAAAATTSHRDRHPTTSTSHQSTAHGAVPASRSIRPGQPSKVNARSAWRRCGVLSASGQDSRVSSINAPAPKRAVLSMAADAPANGALQGAEARARPRGARGVKGLQHLAGGPRLGLRARGREILTPPPPPQGVPRHG